MPSVREGLLKTQPSRLMQFLQPYIDRLSQPSRAPELLAGIEKARKDYKGATTREGMEFALRTRPELGAVVLGARGLLGGLGAGGDVLKRMEAGEDVGPRETLPLALLATPIGGRGGLGAGPRFKPKAGGLLGEKPLPKGVSLKVDEFSREVRALKDGKEIGYLSLEKYGDDATKQTAFNMAVKPAWKRKGIMTALHREAERTFGPMTPSPTLSDEGFNFWRRYRPEAVAGDLRNRTDTLMGQTIQTGHGVGKVKSVGSGGVIAELKGGKTSYVPAREVDAAISATRPNAPAELGTFKSTTPLSIVRMAKKKGGHSVSLLTGEKPAEGFMVGKYPNTDPRTRVIKGAPTVKEIKAFAEKHRKALSKPENYLGVWSDEGKTYIEVSKQWEPTGIRPATKAAEKAKQISMYDAGTGGFPPVGSYPGFVSGEKTPEGVVPYAQRLQEMGAAGREYMQGQPQQDWWATPNMTRVYGKNLQPQMHGLLAATSGNTRPPPNVETASEYMRRVIKGEPMVQPQYTVPPTALFRTPGAKLGLEAPRQHNLEAAARGDLGLLRGPVIKEKVQALQGDPLAIVLDRIHVRATEQPSAGIFATASEGKTPVGKDRDLIKTTITEQAKIAGETPSVFSANVWAGLREHVKKHGELYGTELKGTQRTTLTSESKSYDDIFMDKVRAKAKHLGLTVKQMEKKLRNGDAELLSFLLATPFVAEAYLRSRRTGEQ